MTESRENKRHCTREHCFAHIMLKQTKIIGYVADISHGGFKVRMVELLEWPASERETVGIQFDEIGIGYFQLSARLKWRQDEEKSTLLGFEIESFETPEGAVSYEKIRKEYEIAGSCD